MTDDPDVLISRGQDLPGILGSLFEKILDHTGAWPDDWSEKQWSIHLSCCFLKAEDVMAMLRDVAMDYGIDWQDMQLSPGQADSVGLTRDANKSSQEDR